MGRAGTAWAVPDFGALGALRVLTSIARPRVRAPNPNADAPAALALSGRQFGRLVGRYGKSESGVGYDAGWIAHASFAPETSMTSGEPALPTPGRAEERLYTHWGRSPEAQGPSLTPCLHLWRSFPARAFRPGSDQTWKSPPATVRSNPELASNVLKSPASTRIAPTGARERVKGSVGAPVTQPRFTQRFR